MSHCHTIIAALRERGYRITPQREMVIGIIAHADHHMSAEEIYLEMGKQTQATNLATVYRTLDMLWEEGFARRNDLSEGKTLYATFKHGPHIHLVCRCCNQVMDTDPHILVPLGEELYARYSFKADLNHISVFGICVDCQT
ncbi:Fur family transcriptional regulator [Chloroflexota bacterium]